MISRLDKDVGRIVGLLDELGLCDNTLVLFSADNGTTYLEKQVDYKFFKSVGPLRGLKGSLYEGGIRVPLVARWPGKITPSTKSEHISASWDVLPTLSEVAGAEAPAGVDGISFLPTLLGESDKQRQHEFLYWEFPAYGGQQAVRMGPWKAVRQNMGKAVDAKRLTTELYNLDDDIGESKDLAAVHPELVAQAEKIMQAAHTPSSVFPLPPIDRP